MNMDSEKQKDEILALESIYNTEEFSYCTIKDQYEVTLKIFISLPEGYFFTYNDNQDEQEEQKVHISHLPPLMLSVTLPQDYPSTSPPKFILRSSWLKYSSMCKLCRELDRIWKANEGQEILFLWINFLQSETLQFLHIEESIDISYVLKYNKNNLINAQKNLEGNSCQNATAKENCEDVVSKKVGEKVFTNSQYKDFRRFSRNKCKKNKKPKFDKRAVFDFLSGTHPIKRLIDYNSKRNDIEFKKSFYTCKICFSDKMGEHCIQFKPCNHIFCKDCITGYFESRIKEGSVQNIRCPEDKCESEVYPNQIKDLISPELFSKYDTILLNATLDTMTDIIYCPRKICQYPVSREPDEIMAYCPVCEYAFCILCKAVYHGVEPCKFNMAEKQQIIKDYQEASAEKKLELEQRYGKKQLQLTIENAQSEIWIQNNSQHCPKCNAAIEKSDGCNKMTCWKCQTFFCWVCKAKLKKEDPYSHYGDPKSECYKKLYYGLIFDEDEEDDDDGGFIFEDADDEDYLDYYEYHEDEDYYFTDDDSDNEFIYHA